MAGILVESRRWPLVEVWYPPKISDQDVAQFLEELLSCRQRREPYALLIDSSSCRGLSAKQRKMMADHITEGLDLTRRYLKAFAYVANSRVQQGMLTAVFWIRPPEYPHRVFTNIADAELWVRKFLPQIPNAERRTAL